MVIGSRLLVRLAVVTCFLFEKMYIQLRKFKNVRCFNGLFYVFLNLHWYTGDV